MKKITLAIVYLIASINVFSATLAENFDGFTGSGYTTHSYNGWTIVDGLSENGGTYKYGTSGRSVRLDDDNGAALHSPEKSGGIGTISFYYRNWSSPAINFFIYTSVDSSTWIKVDSVMGATNTTYMQFTTTVNDNSGKYIKIESEGQKMLLLDDVSVTDAVAVSTGCSKLFFSEYAEQGNNKYVEIYNPTSSAITLTGAYSIERYSNGGTSGFSIPLTGTIPAYGTFIVANTSANSTILAAATANGMTSGSLNYNGDDALALFSGSDTLDIFGTIGVDPGSSWGSGAFETDDNVLQRKSTIQSGDSTNSATFDPSIEWNSLGNNVYTDINAHTSSCLSGCTGFFTDSIVDTICSLDSVSFRGVFRKTAGIYRDTVLSTCDTIFILNLFTETYTTYDVFDTICSVNDSILFNGTYLKTAGVYYDTSARTGLCDSISKLTLTAKSCPLPCNDLFFSEYIEGRSSNKAIEIYNPTSSAISMSGYEVKLYANGSISAGNTLTLSGSIPAYGVYVISNSGSSLSGITTNSDITSSVTFFNGNDVLELVKNSIVIDVIGTVGSSSNFASDVTMVRNSGVQQGNTTYTASEWIMMAQDVDTMIGFHQSICQPCTPDRDTTIVAICEGDSATNGISFYSVTGVFADTLTNITGCDSIRVLDLTVNLIDRDTIADTICMGASVTFGTQTLTMTGTYADTVQNTAGCDSITVMELLVNDFLRDTISDTICMGASVTFGTQTLTMTGTYADTVQNIAGCDSITVMELLVNDFLRGTFMDTICENGPISFGGSVITMAGSYNDTVQTTAGCDSIITLALTVNPVSRDTIVDTICAGSSSLLGTIGYTTTGIYSDTLVSSLGCDSIRVLDLFVITYNNPIITVQACDSFMLPTKGYVYTSGVYRDTVTASTGCDSTLQFFVTMGYQNNSSFSVTACDSYTSPSGKVWNLSGLYRDTIMNASGCDSIMDITLTIHRTNAANRTVSACDSYTVPETGMTYFASGVYNDTATNALGCPFIITTNLTISTVSAGTVSVSGITLTASATGVTYKWLDCNNNYSFIIGNTSQSFTPNRNGSFACQITSSTGCVDTTLCTSINSVNLDEYKVSRNEVVVYPNPASSSVSVEVLSQNTKEPVNITIIDAIGKVVYTNKVNAENNTVVIDVNEFENGVYSVIVSNEYFTTTKRLVISK